MKQVWWDMKLQLPTTGGSLLAASRRPAAGSRCSFLPVVLAAAFCLLSRLRQLSVTHFVEYSLLLGRDVEKGKEDEGRRRDREEAREEKRVQRAGQSV